MEIDTTALPVQKVITVVKSSKFLKFVIDLYDKNNVARATPMIAYDICQAINDTTNGSEVAIPVQNKIKLKSKEYSPEKSIIIQINDLCYDLTDKIYDEKGISIGYANSTYVNAVSFGPEAWTIRDYIIDKTKQL
jgi:hypothetical protein